jgi:acyl-coenzyme A synthetase/AMP-(fatty) acid ligase
VPPVERIFTATAPLAETLARDLESALNTVVVDIFGTSESGIVARRHTSRESIWTLADDFDLLTTSTGIEVHARHLPDKVHIPDVIESAGARRFRWLGHIQDMVNIAGKRGSLNDLNQRLLRVPGVEDGVIFMPEGLDRRLAALVVAPGLGVSDIIDGLRPQVEPLFLPRPVYFVDKLPRQGTGKLSSADVNSLYKVLRKAKATGQDQGRPIQLRRTD